MEELSYIFQVFSCFRLLVSSDKSKVTKWVTAWTFPWAAWGRKKAWREQEIATFGIGAAGCEYCSQHQLLVVDKTVKFCVPCFTDDQSKSQMPYVLQDYFRDLCAVGALSFPFPLYQETSFGTVLWKFLLCWNQALSHHSLVYKQDRPSMVL